MEQRTQSLTAMNAANSIKHIATLNTVTEVREFVKEDTRASVLDAATKRIEALVAAGAEQEQTKEQEQEQPAADTDGASTTDTEEEEEEEEEEQEQEQAATPPPAQPATPPSAQNPATPGPNRGVDALPPTKEHQRPSARSASSASQPPPMSQGKGDRKPTATGAYFIKGGEGKGNGRIFFGETSYLRRELAKDQALMKDLYERGCKAVKRLK